MFIILSRHFPAVTFFKAGAMMVYPGDVLDTEAVIDFLTNEEALELPDKIEAVDDENLFRWRNGNKFSQLKRIFCKDFERRGARGGSLLRGEEEGQHEGSPAPRAH